MNQRLLLVDHKDSFTHILIDYFQQINWTVDCVQSEEILNQNPSNYDLIVLSPGYGKPEDKKETLLFIDKYQGQKPFLGICLGHQLLSLANGGTVKRAKKPLHGVVTKMNWVSSPITKGLKSIKIMHYHSWVVDAIPASAQILSHCDSSKEIMGMIDQSNHFLSWQFHPESIGTEWGLGLLEWSIGKLINEPYPPVID